jgi:hypothetical protein
LSQEFEDFETTISDHFELVFPTRFLPLPVNRLFRPPITV